MTQTYWIETLGCPKNQVDSEKLAGKLGSDGYIPAADASEADLVVVNTCAFIDQARQESIDTTLALAEDRREGSRLVVTGCMAERYGSELAAALPEVDAVVGFGRELAPEQESLPQRKLIPVASAALPDFDLLNLPRPKSSSPWAYVKIAEGCDRACGFCAIPSFRGPQRSRSIAEICAEVDMLSAQEIVLVAQDLAAFGRDQGKGERQIVELVDAVSDLVPWTRLLYLYPSDLTDTLIEAIFRTGVPYFDLSLQHVSRPLLRGMKRWGDGAKFLERIETIRAREPGASFRSNFIVGYPGETEHDQDELLEFVSAAQLDWCGFFEYSAEESTHAATLADQVPEELRSDRIAELRELQDGITAARRDSLIGTQIEVLVDAIGEARSFREAPEIDGIVQVPEHLVPGSFVTLTVTNALGPDLVAS